MKSAAKIATIVTYVLSTILWILAILTYVFNVLGLWAPWHLAGFGFVFFIPIPLISWFVSFIKSCREGEGKLIFSNIFCAIISVALTLFTVNISAGWFW